MRILIVDDEGTSRLMLKAIAGKLGHDTLVASDGESAWDLLQAEEVDVLLTDWMMPGMDGPELCRRVRNQMSTSYVYIVMITSLGFPDQILEGMGAGADDYLVKPVDAFALQTRLVAAERVTSLHRQVAHFQSQLEAANLELLDKSLTDELTRLGNRRRMEMDLMAIQDRAERTGSPYAVAIFDVDHFKLYNDHYGHQSGDDALRRVAGAIAREASPHMTAFRYGGEEFLVAMPDTSLEDAQIQAERMGQAVAALGMPHAHRPSQPPFVTTSAGVAGRARGDRATLASVVRAADEALFRAKSEGRNRTCTASAADVLSCR